MGMRKKINQINKIKREASKVVRDKKRVKREKKEKTPGQKLHDKMHDRS